MVSLFCLVGCFLCFDFFFLTFETNLSFEKFKKQDREFQGEFLLFCSGGISLTSVTVSHRLFPPSDPLSGKGGWLTGGQARTLIPSQVLLTPKASVPNTFNKCWYPSQWDLLKSGSLMSQKKAKHHHSQTTFPPCDVSTLNQHHKWLKWILNLRKRPLVKHFPWGVTQRGWKRKGPLSNYPSQRTSRDTSEYTKESIEKWKTKELLKAFFKKSDEKKRVDSL